MSRSQKSSAQRSVLAPPAAPQPTKRVLQNRKAQKEFRERRARKIRDLEDMEVMHRQCPEREEAYRIEIDNLRKDIMILQQLMSDAGLSTPTQSLSVHTQDLSFLSSSSSSQGASREHSPLTGSPPVFLARSVSLQPEGDAPGWARSPRSSVLEPPNPYGYGGTSFHADHPFSQRESSSHGSAASYASDLGPSTAFDLAQDYNTSLSFPHGSPSLSSATFPESVTSSPQTVSALGYGPMYHHHRQAIARGQIVVPPTRPGNPHRLFVDPYDPRAL